MLPLALPEPAGGPPAVPPSVPTPNQLAGVGPDPHSFAAMVDAGSSGHGGTGAAKGAGKQIRAGASNWLLTKLSVLAATTDGSAASPVVTPQQDAKTSDDANVTDVSDGGDDDESTDVPFATTAVMTLLCNQLPAAAPAAIRIPVPGDEDAEHDQLPVTAGDETVSNRFTGLPRAEGEAAPAVLAGHEQVMASAAIDAIDPATTIATNAMDAQTSLAATSPADGVDNPANTAHPPGVDGSSTALGTGTIGSTIPAVTSASQDSHAEQALLAAKQSPESKPANRGESARPWASDVRPFRPAVFAHAPQGATIRSAVAVTATNSDEPADGARAIVDAGSATAVPGQDAPGVAGDESSARSTPSEFTSRRVDATNAGLSFSANRDASESGARDEEGRGRQTSAMSARLAAAVASTSEQSVASRSTTTPSPVFDIPAVTAATSPAVTATAEAHATTAPALPAENVERLVQAMHVNVRSGVMEATLRLRPEHFGEVTIQLRVDGTNVTALIQTESSGVRQWLASQEQAIRNGLATHGLELDRLVVNPDGEQRQPRDDSEANESRRRAYRRRQHSTERFEITV